MASLPYPLNRLYNHGRVGMAGMPYPPTDCHLYIKINKTTSVSCAHTDKGNRNSINNILKIFTIVIQAYY